MLNHRGSSCPLTYFKQLTIVAALSIITRLFVAITDDRSSVIVIMTNNVDRSGASPADLVEGELLIKIF